MEYFFVLYSNSKEFGKYSYANVVNIHGFTNYNREHGWEKGNDFLKKYAKFLSNSTDDGLFFRINGDDFLMISRKKIDKELLINLELLNETSLSVTISYFDLELSSHVNALKELVGYEI
ncbi:MAG: GGDEF domain-containing protein [Campylobacterales bacterium]|nr:GGDEF domain-containing protein [Campylobacterales bacterium]